MATATGLRLGEQPVPSAGPGQVLARPLAVGICGSDLHAIEQLAQLGEEELAFVLGHEFCAEVAAHGPGVTAPPVGTRVVSVPYARAGTRAGGEVDGEPELLGLSTVLPGALSERMVLDAERLVAVPDHVDDEVAALVEPLAVGRHAVARAAPVPGEVALVAGCGPVGLMVLADLVAEGLGPVVASDPSPVRRRAAEALGAAAVVDPDRESPYDRVRALAHEERPPSPLLPPGTRPRTVVAFECVGAPGLAAELVAGCPRHTDVVVAGVCLQPDTVEPGAAIEREASLSYVFAYRPDDVVAALELLAGGAVDTGALISRVTDLAGLAEACRALEAGEEVKVVVRPTGEGAAP